MSVIHRTFSLKFTRKKRLISLDVYRGFNIILMIFVDQIGDTWPIIDHSPWNGISVADLVMPYINIFISLLIYNIHYY